MKSKADRTSSAVSRRIRRAIPRARRGFTLMEILIAGLVAAMVLTAVTTSLSNLGKARGMSKMRYDAYRRADAALNVIRRNIASILRSDDLFDTNLTITDDTSNIGSEEFANDSILLFSTAVHSSNNSLDFSGEGSEYEVQYRIIDPGPQLNPVLWERRDVQPDEYHFGGGIASPIVEGIVGLSFQAYDGELWYDSWDSDYDGLPRAVRITVVASGYRKSDEIADAPRAVLRTVVAIDRVTPPRDLFVEVEEQEPNAPTDEAGEQPVDLDGDGIPDAPAGGDGDGGIDVPGRPGDGPDGGGGRPPSGGGGDGGNSGGDEGGGKPLVPQINLMDGHGGPR